MTEFDIEQALADLKIDTAGPPQNHLCYKRHEFARELYRLLKDKKQPPRPDYDPNSFVGGA